MNSVVSEICWFWGLVWTTAVCGNSIRDLCFSCHMLSWCQMKCDDIRQLRYVSPSAPLVVTVVPVIVFHVVSCFVGTRIRLRLRLTGRRTGDVGYWRCLSFGGRHASLMYFSARSPTRSTIRSPIHEPRNRRALVSTKTRSPSFLAGSRVLQVSQ